MRSFEAPANEFLLFLSAIESNQAFVGNELKALEIVSAKVPKGNSYNFIN